MPIGQPLWIDALLFAGAALVVALSGPRLASVADRLADRTGIGEAVAGAVFLGGATSLPGIVTSITAAASGVAALAVSNALGGIAVQTAFLAVADILYRRANLEHAAASLGNMLQAALLVALLSIPLVAMTQPGLAVGSVHVATPAMFLLYAFGVRIAMEARQAPMWEPAPTPETREDRPDGTATTERLGPLWLRFAALGLAVAVAGYVIATTGVRIAAETWLSETAVGALLTAVVTSLPELVTTIAAVRRGAETMAVAGIIGGNAFDTLFLAASDLFYRQGSIYAAIEGQALFLLAATILMTSLLLLGLLRRERHGLGNIGFEGVLVLAVYGSVLVVLATG